MEKSTTFSVLFSRFQNSVDPRWEKRFAWFQKHFEAFSLTFFFELAIRIAVCYQVATISKLMLLFPRTISYRIFQWHSDLYLSIWQIPVAFNNTKKYTRRNYSERPSKCFWNHAIPLSETDSRAFQKFQQKALKR